MRFSLVALILLCVISLTAFGASVSGTVTNELGDPIAFMAIYIYGDIMWESTLTDIAGEYRFDGLDVGWYYINPEDDLISTPWYHEVYVTSPTESFTGLDFVITSPPDPDAFITGRVTYSDGSPASFVEVYGWPYDMPLDYETYTDADGYYTIAVAGGDFYYISCWLYGYMPMPDSYEFYISSGDSLTDYDFVLYPDTIPEEMTIEVFVMNEFYEGISGVKVTCTYEMGGMSSVNYTDEWGYVYFYVLEPGSYILTAEKIGFTFSPDSETVYIDEWTGWVYAEFVGYPETPTDFGIEVFAVDSLGSPVESLFVEWRPTSGGTWSAVRTNADGFAYIDLPLAGSYELNTLHPNPAAIITPPTMILSVDEFEPIARANFTVHIPSSISETERPDQLGIFVTPNPFNSAVRIRVEAGNTRAENLEIFDVSGRRVASLPSLDSEIIWAPAEYLPAGIYLVRARVGENEMSKRLIYMK